MLIRKEITMTNTTIETKMNEVLALVDFSMFRNMLANDSAEVREAEFKETFAVAMESKTFINTHNRRNSEEKFDGFAVLRNGYIVLLMNDTYFCLNEMYVEDGKLHLSTLSVAGNIISKDLDMSVAVNNYNEEYIRYNEENAPKEIVFFHTVK
jgi:hypothetical protein